MNFLGHLFFSRNDTELMLANLYGDFVKGKDLTRYRFKTQQGIFLHRCIDSYIDSHHAVREVLQILYEPLPKVSGIAIDLYFDHLLALHWKKFHPEELDTYLFHFYSSVNLKHSEFSSEFKFLISKMIEKNWIIQYQYEYGLDKACRGVSGRISFPNELVHGLSVFQKYKTQIESAFFEYMQDACLHFDSLVLIPEGLSKK